MMIKRNGIKYINTEHYNRFIPLLATMLSQDSLHIATAYILAFPGILPADLYNFAEDHIIYNGLQKEWQTHTTRKCTRLLYNLWNQTYIDQSSRNRAESSYFYSVDAIFSNQELAPYFYEAISLKKAWIEYKSDISNS